MNRKTNDASKKLFHFMFGCLGKCCGKELLLSSFAFCGNDAVTMAGRFCKICKEKRQGKTACKKLYRLLNAKYRKMNLRRGTIVHAKYLCLGIIIETMVPRGNEHCHFN